MTLLQAIKSAARTASKAAYSGRVSIYSDNGIYGVAEHNDSNGYNPEHTEIYSIPCSEYYHESATVLIKEAREHCKV